MDCVTCKPDTSGYKFCIKYQEVVRSAEIGCSKCSFIAKCVELNFSDVKDLLIDAQLGHYLQVTNLDRENFDLDIFTEHEQEYNPLEIAKTANSLPGNTGSAETVATIKRWLNECETTHDKCQHHDYSKHLGPNSAKRFLKISDRSVALQEDVQVERYACLSHCWGNNANPIKTTTNNIENHRIEIPWEKLSSTFQHAVTICNALDIPYLWIDSLCIIQDSKEDWNSEASKMANIYENAYITIAATKSSDGAGGCFATTAPEYMSKLVPGYINTYVRQKLPKFPQLSSDYKLKDIPDWPLFNRAWIYQEIRLSRRALHFCAQEVILICQTAQKSESGDDDRDLVNEALFEGLREILIPYGILQQDPRRLWYRMIQEYTRLQLSFKEDKMIALAGIAQRMSSLRSGDLYLAGLWKGTLLLDLLWRSKSWSGTSRPKITCYPSWSWASLDGQVEFPGGNDLALESVLVEEINYTSDGPMYMGAYLQASITLRAPLLDAGPFFAQYQSHSTEMAFMTRHTPYSEMWLDPSADVITNLDHLYIIFHIPDSTADKFKVDLADADHSTFIIPIAAAGPYPQCFQAIVVKRKSESDCYERIGFVTLEHPVALPGYSPSNNWEVEERKRRTNLSVKKNTTKSTNFKDHIRIVNRSAGTELSLI